MLNWRAQLLTTNITQDQVDSKLQCSICLEDYQLREEVLRLQCLHCFHESCIAPWLNHNNFCPTCRSRAISNNIYVIPSSEDVLQYSIEFDNVEDFAGGSDVTSLESDSEESYIDDESMLDDEFEDVEEETSESEVISDIIEMNNVELVSDNESMEGGNTEESNEELSMSDGSIFYETDTGIGLFSDDDDDEGDDYIDNEQ